MKLKLLFTNVFFCCGLINSDGGALVSKYIYNVLTQIANYEEALVFIKQN